MKLSHPTWLDYIAIVALAIAYGSAFAPVEVALNDWGPITIALFRVTIGAIGLGVIMVWQGLGWRYSWSDWKLFIALTVIGSVLPLIAVNWGQTRIDSNTTAVLIGSMPLMTLVLAQFWTHDERITTQKFIGLLLGFGGIVAMFGGVELSGDFGVILGQGAVLVTALCYAISGIIIRKTKHLPPLVAPTFMMVLSIPLLAILTLIYEPGTNLSPSSESLWAMLYIGTIPTIFALWIMFWIIGRVGATMASVNNYISPAVGLIIGAYFLNEVIRPEVIHALVLILIGSAISMRKPKVKG